MASRPRPVLDAARTILQGDWPDRYQGDWWRGQFDAFVAPSLVEGAAVLDAGSGREPAIAKDRRPPGCTYTGLDISEAELRAAPAGSYDDVVVGDLVEHHPELTGRFDLAVSWQVLEHVKPLDGALDNLRSYLRPGGRLVAQLSGSYSLFALADKVMPTKAKQWVLQRVQGRSASSVFPAHYDRCWHSALGRMLEPWSEWEVVPVFSGAGYFTFARPALAAYVAWEEWVRTRGHDNLAPYYLIVATR